VGVDGVPHLRKPLPVAGGDLGLVDQSHNLLRGGASLAAVSSKETRELRRMWARYSNMENRMAPQNSSNAAIVRFPAAKRDQACSTS